MSDKQLKKYLQKLSKEQVIELYLQKYYDQEFVKTEILTKIYNQIMDTAYFQVSIFGGSDIVIPQTKFIEIFTNGGNNENTNIT